MAPSAHGHVLVLAHSAQVTPTSRIAQKVHLHRGRVLPAELADEGGVSEHAVVDGHPVVHAVGRVLQVK